MITYLEGDATHPVGGGQKIIVHVNNDIGGWGSGFVLALSKRWSEPEARYRAWRKDGWSVEGGVGAPFKLGEIQPVGVTDDIVVCNMVAQHGYYPRTEPPFIRYDALQLCLEKVSEGCARMGGPVSVHMPRIGCGLAGGRWTEVEPVVERTLVEMEVPVFVYDLPN